VAVAPLAFFERKEINIFFAPFAILTKGVVPMIFRQHLYVTYDNDRCNSCNRSFYSNYCVFQKTQIKEKDNRPASISAVIFD
jgi:hypothetical protein